MTLTNIIIYATAVLALINTTLMVFLWRKIGSLNRFGRQTAATAQRLDRELAQQRYAVAMVRQIQQGETEQTDDAELLDQALESLDKVAAIEAEKPSENDGSKSAKQPVDVAVDSLKEKEILQFIKMAIKNNHVAVSRQPIVTLPRREVRFYEIFARVLVGDQGYLPAHQFVSVAKDNNLMGMIDNLLLLRCLQLIKQNSKKEQNTGFFVNISVQTLGSKNYISDLVSFLEANPRLSSRLIFEITQEDSMKITPTARSVMENLALLGCRFSMDQVTLLGMDVERLVSNNITFVKLDARMLIKEMDDLGAAKRLKRIKNTLETAGIEIIMEKVENEKQLYSLLDLYVSYAQGYHFGQPELMA